MKLIGRLGLILLTGFISICTASAQLYGTANTNAPELRVPKSVKPAFDYCCLLYTSDAADEL